MRGNVVSSTPCLQAGSFIAIIEGDWGYLLGGIPEYCGVSSLTVQGSWNISAAGYIPCNGGAQAVSGIDGAGIPRARGAAIPCGGCGGRIIDQPSPEEIEQFGRGVL